MTFDFKTKPYAHQLEVFERSSDLEYFALFMEQGTGKSKVVIDTASKAFLDGKISAVVLFANKGVYGNWHYEELPKHSSIPYRTYVWRGYYKTGEHGEFVRSLERGPLVWFLVNIDALPSPRLQALLTKFLKAHPMFMFVGDETTSIKNFKSARTKAALKIAPQAHMRRILSGLPNPQSPLDLFSQFQFLKPGILGHSSFYSFKNHYAVREIAHYGSRSFAVIKGYRDLEGLNRRILKMGAIIKKDDCLDLPPKQYKTMYVDLTDKQRSAYDDLVTKAVTYIEQHEITAINALSLITRLLQICCGQLKVGDDSYVSIENNRIQAVEDLIDETSSKVVVWTHYKRTAQDIMARLKDRAILIPGGLDADERHSRLSQFKRAGTQVLVANPASSGHGITLTEAKLVIYYSNSYNLEHRIQSEDRTHRIGQTDSVPYVDLVAPNTIEPTVIARLKEKKTLSDEVINANALREFINATGQ